MPRPGAAVVVEDDAKRSRRELLRDFDSLLTLRLSDLERRLHQGGLASAGEKGRPGVSKRPGVNRAEGNGEDGLVRADRTSPHELPSTDRPSSMVPAAKAKRPESMHSNALRGHWFRGSIARGTETKESRDLFFFKERNVKWQSAMCNTETHNSVASSRVSGPVRVGEEDKELRDKAIMEDLHAQETFSASGLAPPEPSKLQLLVAHPCFDAFFGILVLGNAILLGIHVELTTIAPEMENSLAIIVGGWLFAVAFALELLFRLLADGLRIFCICGREWVWLDTILVVLSLLEVIADLATVSESFSYGGIRMVRVLKIIRLTRSLKLARLVRLVSPLRSQLLTISAAMRSLIWSFGLLFLVMFVMSLIFVQCYLDHRSSRSANWTGKNYWGGLMPSMVTLFQSVCGGIGWSEALVPLAEAGGLYSAMFCVYILFAVFCVLNGVTGAFCNSAIEAAMQNVDVLADNIEKRNLSYMARLTEVFHRLDTDRSGWLTVMEFEHVLSVPHTSACLMAMDIDGSDAWTLFKLLDQDGDGQISIDEFIQGCVRLKGAAKALDFQQLMHQVDLILEALDRMSLHSEHQVSRIKELLHHQDTALKMGLGLDHHEQHSSHGLQH
eukprot:TRINITY_DN59395_c0_g1_i1.p1 TRINITY_DN59395_c0_g1~~TRINITY_DN59395_c0_g1_i1.p1  ORF type:complete len:613 (+),score=78.80 TRINITY_DN59395_c0_g1_i1:28-1866(+)